MALGLYLGYRQSIFLDRYFGRRRRTERVHVQIVCPLSALQASENACISVLCYNPCISFVAIEKYVGLFVLLYKCFPMLFHVLKDYVLCMIVAYYIVCTVGGHGVVWPEGFGTCMSWCGEPLSRG